MVDPLPAVTLGDFTHKFGGSLADRDKVYAVTAAHWSHDWIAIPNPTCGSFESAPYLTDYSRRVDEQLTGKVQGPQALGRPDALN